MTFRRFWVKEPPSFRKYNGANKGCLYRSARHGLFTRLRFRFFGGVESPSSEGPRNNLVLRRSQHALRLERAGQQRAFWKVPRK